MKDELGQKIVNKFVKLRGKNYNYLIDDGSEGKKGKSKKKCVMKRKHNFEIYKNCLKATQLKNEVNVPERNQIDVDNLKEYHQESIRNNKSILKTQQIFKCKKHIVFTEVINQIALISNGEQRI